MSNQPTQPTITFTPTLRDKLRSAYDMARLNNKEVFEFGGGMLVTDYAKYLLEYLDTKFPPPDTLRDKLRSKGVRQ